MLELAVLTESRESQPLVYHSRPSSPTNSRSLFFLQDHGSDFTGERRVEGIIVPGDRVLLVDDLITTGRSLRRAAEAIRAEGGVVRDAVVLLDREEGGNEKLAEYKVSSYSLLTGSEAAEKLYQIGAITEDQVKIIKRQVKRSRIQPSPFS
jgi:orotate phosphoribosyltransferase